MQLHQHHHHQQFPLKTNSINYKTISFIKYHHQNNLLDHRRVDLARHGLLLREIHRRDLGRVRRRESLNGCWNGRVYLQKVLWTKD
jgi:hypothetical protein